MLVNEQIFSQQNKINTMQEHPLPPPHVIASMTNPQLIDMMRESGKSEAFFYGLFHEKRELVRKANLGRDKSGRRDFSSIISRKN